MVILISLTINPNRNPFQIFNFLWILIFQTPLMNVHGLKGIQPVAPLIERLQLIRWRHTPKGWHMGILYPNNPRDNSFKWLYEVKSKLGDPRKFLIES